MYCGGKVKVVHVILRYFDLHNDNKCLPYSCTMVPGPKTVAACYILFVLNVDEMFYEEFN